MKLTTVTEYIKAIANGPISQIDSSTCQSACVSAVWVHRIAPGVK